MVNRPASSCGSLIPQAWRKPVPGAPLPVDLEVGSWITFGDKQTGQLDKANDRVASTIEIVEGCDKRDAETVHELRPKKWWEIWR